MSKIIIIDVLFIFIIVSSISSRMSCLQQATGDDGDEQGYRDGHVTER